MTEFLEYDTVKQWLDRLAPSTQEVQGYYFKTFMKWVKVNGKQFKDYNPDQLIEYQKQAGNGNLYDLLDTMIQPYIRSKRGTFNTKKSRYNSIRSFFVHNRAELPRDKTFNINPETPPIRGELTPDEIRRCLISCSPMYKALFLSMFQSAMDQEMVTYWSDHGLESLREQLRSDPNVIQIELPGRKANKMKAPYYTFIARDGVEALMHWMKYRDSYIKKGRLPSDAKAIFCNQKGNSIIKRAMREYWLKKLRKLGIVEPLKRGTRATKTGKGLHEMRDTFKSLWEKSPASGTVAEYVMGHKIDKLEYDKSFRDSDYYRAEYLKAAPYLNILSRGEAYGQVDGSEVEYLKRQLAEAKKGQSNDVAELAKKNEEMKSELEKLKRQQTEMLEAMKKLVEVKHR